MARKNIEAAVENMLQASFATALAADTITGVSFRKFWTSDTSANIEQIALPTIMIKADPNTHNLDGYHSPYRQVPVTVSMMTSELADPKRTTLNGIYNAIREDIDFGTFADSDLDPVEVMAVPGGQSSITESDKGAINQVDLPLTVEVAYPGG